VNHVHSADHFCLANGLPVPARGGASGIERIAPHAHVQGTAMQTCCVVKINKEKITQNK
jgi:hypothetical protein